MHERPYTKIATAAVSHADAELDLEKLRAETPGVAHCVNLNNAGASLMPAPVIAALEHHLRLESEIGGQAAALRRAEGIEAVHGSLARLLGAAPETIALATNAIRAWQLAFYGLSFGPGDRILTSRAEYGSNYVGFLQMRKRTGCRIEVITDDGAGATDPAALDEMIVSRVRLDEDNYEMRAGARRSATYQRALGGALGLGIERIARRVGALAAYLRAELARRPGVKRRHLGAEKCGIVAFTQERLSAPAIRDRMAGARIQVSVSPPEGTLLDATAPRLGRPIRVSPHCYNSEAELDLFLAELDRLIEAL